MIIENFENKSMHKINFDNNFLKCINDFIFQKIIYLYRLNFFSIFYIFC